MTCRICSTKMVCTCVEDCEDESGAYEQTFTCPKCGHIEGRIVY